MGGSGSKAAALSFEDMNALVSSKLSGKEANTFILDVRGVSEVKSSGIIPTAVNVPLDQLDSALKSTAEDFQKTYSSPKPVVSDRVVTYCMRGMRAESAAKIMTSNGYTSVEVYPGSWSEWSKKYIK